MFQHIVSREIGHHHPQILRNKELRRRTYSLELSVRKEFKPSSHCGNVLCLDIDKSEWRYLLSGAGDASMCLWDLSLTLCSQQKITFQPLVKIEPSLHCGTHRSGISSVHWYPGDTGLFLSGGFDETMRVWNTNTLEMVYSFHLNSKVYSISMAQGTNSHHLVAVGTSDHKVRLCDLRTGNSVHHLLGHRDSIFVTQWRPGNEYQLVSGSADGTLRLWDIRRGGCLVVFNKNKTEFQVHSVETPPKKKKQKIVHIPYSTPTSIKSHDGFITAVHWTPNGRFVLSSGTDNTMRLWEVDKEINTLVSYDGVKNFQRKGSQIAVSSNGELVYHPNEQVIMVFEIFTGKLVNVLRGHYNKVNCCVFHPFIPELYSGGNDWQIILWTPLFDEYDEKQQHEENEEILWSSTTTSDDDNDNNENSLINF